jgi:hypothetical protein
MNTFMGTMTKRKGEKLETFTCYDCEESGICVESLVQPLPYNCDSHSFKEKEREATGEGVITKRRWVCEYCRLPMSIIQTGIYRGVQLYGLLA